MNAKLTAALAAYAAAIIGANLLTHHAGFVGVGFGLTASAGALAAGFALLARDAVREAAGVNWRWWVLGAIAAGAVVSVAMTTPMLAVASGVAFVGAELVDLVVYERARRRGFATAALASNAVSAPLDSLVFLWLAPFPLAWPAFAGQVVAKWLWATALPVCLYLIASRRAR